LKFEKLYLTACCRFYNVVDMAFIWTYPFVITAFILSKNKLSSISMDRNDSSTGTVYGTVYDRIYPIHVGAR